MLSFYQRYFGKGQTQLTLKISVIFFFSQALRERKRLRYSTSERFCYCFALLKKLNGYRKHLLSHYGNEGWHAFVRQATEECRLDQVTFCWTKSKLWLLLFLNYGSIHSHSLRLMCSIITKILTTVEIVTCILANRILTAMLNELCLKSQDQGPILKTKGSFRQSSSYFATKL